jgi:hypothetical protein
MQILLRKINLAGSFKKIDYRLRPAKHAERVMLIDLFRRMRFAPIESYQYIGFGSVAFIDFKMVYKCLGIKDLISIEGTEDEDEKSRFRNNNPYDAALTLHFGLSSAVLPTLELNRKSLVWLDYDGSLARSMANDLATIGRHVHSGSFVGVTFTTAFPTTKDGRDQELNRLKNEFPDFLPEDTKANAFDGPKYAEFGRSTLGAILEKAVSDADAGLQDEQKRRAVRQVCFFRYKDGIQMVTVGWLIVSAEEQPLYEAAQLAALPFFRGSSEAFKIEIPLVTPYEIREMERKLPDLINAGELSWIPEDQRKYFSNVHRYLPQFAPVEQI